MADPPSGQSLQKTGRSENLRLLRINSSKNCKAEIYHDLRHTFGGLLLGVWVYKLYPRQIVEWLDRAVTYQGR